jgi:hypothetical protein
MSGWERPEASYWISDALPVPKFGTGAGTTTGNSLHLTDS